jgi:hypothetical protein
MELLLVHFLLLAKLCQGLLILNGLQGNLGLEFRAEFAPGLFRNLVS